MTTEEFYEKYCRLCGSQRCPGIEDPDWGSGCEHYNEWDDAKTSQVDKEELNL